MSPHVYVPPDPRVEPFSRERWIIRAKRDYRRELWKGKGDFSGSTFIPYDGKTPTFTAQARVFR